ncbi:ABC transporter permease [Thermopolyspora flexuosa]|jgi:NitT/TauT family transport system permease protein|uniref:NitT/TauT family transport system permease protein n=1 Tax=Thermopolyspora flexuosa TaxID=103836 RepID=A0A543ISE6_9ACTN|nr:ABC transporter permease [Thermopolyspora flexuosa]MDI9580182.1 ABC transporter permease [Thermobispora sp.]TQM73514.1 NitT/TauT family transport system permease protein [Thermopolyspora flexuosa]GGM81830.1 ABC transporter permease [Thermopolyspora flexuosa]
MSDPQPKSSETSRAGRRRKGVSTLTLWITTPLLFLAFLGAWKAYTVVFNVGPLMLPPPEQVGEAMVQLLQGQVIYDAMKVTLYETIAGFLLAAVVGIALGIIFGKARNLEKVLSPFLVATQVVPKVAIVPLFLLWFGFGSTSKVVMAAIIAFFVMMQNTILGIRSIDPGHRDLMRVIQAPWWKRVISLDIPSALPYVLTGIELGIVFAITGAVVGEYLGGDEGLGALAVTMLSGLRTDMLFAVVIVMTVLGFLLYAITAAIRRFAIPWHESSGRPTSL